MCRNTRDSMIYGMSTSVTWSERLDVAIQENNDRNAVSYTHLTLPTNREV